MNACVYVCVHTHMQAHVAQCHVWSEDSLQEALLSLHLLAPEIELRPLDLVTSALTH